MPLTVAQPSDSGDCATLIFGHGFWTPLAALAAGEWLLSQKRWRDRSVLQVEGQDPPRSR
jgi:hypothetical protein